MKLDLPALARPLIAALLLALIVQQTLDALRGAGAWRRSRPAARATSGTDPYAPIESALAQRDSATPLRDPFRYAAAPAVRAADRRVPAPGPTPPAVAGVPVLTSIVFDNDPQATIRYHDRDYSVRVNTLFAEFRVVGIARDQVTLDRAGETLVLRLPSKGE